MLYEARRIHSTYHTQRKIREVVFTVPSSVHDILITEVIREI